MRLCFHVFVFFTHSLSSSPYLILGYQVFNAALPKTWLTQAHAAAASAIQRYRETEPVTHANGVSLGEFAQASPHRNPGVDGSAFLNEPYIIGDLLAVDRRFGPLLSEPALWSIAASLLDVELRHVVFHYSNLTRKPAGIGPSISWHRDAETTYFCPDDDRFLRLLIPLQGMSQENGGTAVMPGSHLNKIEKNELDGSAVIYPSLAAGDVLAIHPQLLHGGEPNRSSKERDVLIVQFGVSGAGFRYQETMELGSLHTRDTFIAL